MQKRCVVAKDYFKNVVGFKKLCHEEDLIVENLF